MGASGLLRSAPFSPLSRRLEEVRSPLACPPAPPLPHPHDPLSDGAFDQVGDVLDLELVHDVGAVDLDGLGAQDDDAGGGGCRSARRIRAAGGLGDDANPAGLGEDLLETPTERAYFRRIASWVARRFMWSN